MSSRHQKDKRLRPKSDPYKRDHFNKSRYMGQAMPNKGKPVARQEVVEETDMEAVDTAEYTVVGDETFVSSSVVTATEGQQGSAHSVGTEEA